MITKEDVLRIAQLARIHLDPQEVEKFQKDFSSILEYFALLQEVDVSNVKEMTHSVEIQNVLRTDQENTNKMREGFLQTKEQQEGFLRVPPILPFA